jgi:predicted RecA/RadA family phage recombinase
MAQATLVQDGKVIDYTPSSAVAAGDVIVSNKLVGIATRPIAANELGGLTVEGVFDFAKATGSGINFGALVYWDNTNDVATTTASGNELIGKCVKAAASGDTTVRIKLDQ